RGADPVAFGLELRRAIEQPRPVVGGDIAEGEEAEGPWARHGHAYHIPAAARADRAAGYPAFRPSGLQALPAPSNSALRRIEIASSRCLRSTMYGGANRTTLSPATDSRRP